MGNAIIIKREEFNIKTPLKLKIGDPMYLRDIREGTTTGREKDYVYDEKPYSAGLRETILTITEQIEVIELFPGEEMQFKSIVVNIIGVSTRYSKENREIIKETLKNGEFHESLLEKENPLGCDTAEYLLETDKNRYTIATGADGAYGYYLKYIDDIAYMVELSFDESPYDFERVTELMKSLFEFL